MALTRERTPSQESPVEAPVKMPIWKGFPLACSASAIFASSAVTALAVPAGGKSAQADVVAMFNQACSFCCRNVIECHNIIVIFSCKDSEGARNWFCNYRLSLIFPLKYF